MDARFEDRLGALARRALDGELSGLVRMSGGASQEMWSFDVSDPTGVRGYVLRRTPGGGPERASAAGLAVEAQVIAAAEAAGVPVAHVAHVLTAIDDLGPGFVAERVGGEALGRRVVRNAEFETVRGRLAADCGTILARIHGVPTADLPLQSRTPRQAVERLAAQLAGLKPSRPVHALALRWLFDHAPEEFDLTLVHNDFRTGNFMLEPEGVRAVLDWEGAHRGDPMCDLGWLCMPTWRFGEIDKPVGGFGQRDQLYAAYEAQSGRRVDPERVRFWEVFGMVRWGLTCAGMAQEFKTGDRALERGAVGRRAVESELDLLLELAPRAAP